MLMRTFPITRMPRLCNRLSRVAITGLAFAMLSPLPLIAADDGAQGSPQTEEKSEDKKEASGEEKDKQKDSDLKAKHERKKHHSDNSASGDSHEKAEKIGSDSDKRKSMAAKSARHGFGESAALGVIVVSCPGNAVCVKDVISGSPADDAGLQEGDYILSVNDEQTASPEQLRQVVEQMQSKDKVTLRVWRQGDERTEEVTLASKANRPPESHRAWLGILVSHFEDEGLVVGRVLPGSPAAQAGLEEDDVIQKLNDKQVQDLGSFLECIEDMGPGSEVAIVIDRNGEEQTVKAKLGEIEDAPMAFLREAMRHTDQEQGNQDWGSNELPPMIEQTLDEMQSRIRSLEKQVKELEGSSDEKAGNAMLPADSHDEPLSQTIESIDDNQETLVVQRGRARVYNRGNAFVPNYRGNDYNRTPYRSGYRPGYPPIYRSPGSGNSYYRYGGRPYYYGGYGRNYGYGFRSGIQIGRNFGVYW
jgi:serine protease Do